MIIGHAPASYVIAAIIHPRLFATQVSARAFILAGVLGGLAPDLDMLYFYLIDMRQHHHHSYISHWPVFWLGLLGLSLGMGQRLRNHQATPLAMAFCAAGVLHMLLDSIVGDIRWFAPWLQQPFALFSVPALYRPWWLNFLLHWSFALELGCWAWAAWLWRRRGKVQLASQAPLNAR